MVPRAPDLSKPEGRERNVGCQDDRGGSGKGQHLESVSFPTIRLCPSGLWEFLSKMMGILEEGGTGHFRRIWINGKGQSNVEQDLKLTLAFMVYLSHRPRLPLAYEIWTLCLRFGVYDSRIKLLGGKRPRLGRSQEEIPWLARAHICRAAFEALTVAAQCKGYDDCGSIYGWRTQQGSSSMP